MNQSDTYPKYFYESKSKALFWVFIVFIILLFGIINQTYAHFTDSVYIFNLIKMISIFIIIFCIFLYFYPTTILEIYKDKFIYKKGKFVISSAWSNVKAIAFQIDMGNSSAPFTSFFIDTDYGTTKLIETRILKLRNDKSYKLNLIEFAKELETLSEKKVQVGDISTKKYAKANFDDFIKGTTYPN